MPIQWRYADNGNGQPGPIQTVQTPRPQTAVAGIAPGRTIHIDLAANNFAGSFLTRTTAAADSDPAKIPEIKTAFGNRPLPIPIRYFKEGQAELLDPNTHPMVMGFTHTAVKDGRFNDPTVWNTGTVPGAGSIWTIGDFYIRYTHESDAIMNSGFVGLLGRLTHISSGDTRMRIGYLMTMGCHVMHDLAWSTTQGKPKHEIVFHPVGEAPGATARLGGIFMGPTRHVGAVSVEKLRLKPASGAVASVAAGVTSVAIAGLADAVAAGRIRVGAVMNIGATEYVSTSSTDPQYTETIPPGPTSYYIFSNAIGTKNLNEYQFSQSEERTITNIVGDVAYFAEPLLYAHIGQRRTLLDGTVITLNPVVGFPNRSIRFRTASAQQDSAIDSSADLRSLQKRAHVMYHRNPDIYVQDVEFMNMGRTSTDPSLFVANLPERVEMAGGSVNVVPIKVSSAADSPDMANPQNVLGRYSVHFHWPGGPYANAPLVVCRRVSAWAPKWAPPCPGWGITQHGGNMAIENCLTMNIRGAGIVSELGNERGHWAGNLSMDCRGDGDVNVWGDRHELYANHNGGSGVAFENQSRAIIMHENVAVGCHYAYLWHAQKDKRMARGVRQQDLRLKPSIFKGEKVPLPAMARYDEVVHINDAQIPPFIDNEAWACKFGLAVIHRGGDSRKESPEPMLIQDFHGVNVLNFIHLPEYTNSYYFKDCSSNIGNEHKLESRGIRLPNVGWDFNLFNCYFENYEMAIVDNGVGLNYNGFIVDVLTPNCTSSGTSASAAISGTHATRDVMEPWVESTTTPGRWRIRQHQSIPRSQLPQPYPLEPYGSKMPAGSPVVPIGGQPYFQPGETLNTTLTAGAGRNQLFLSGTIRDSAGDRKLGDWQSSETFPSNISVKTGIRSYKNQPEQIVEWWGCWNDAGTWKSRVWFLYADRMSHQPLAFYFDCTLVGFDADFLATHDLGGPSSAPQFPFALERTRQTPRPLAPIVSPINMLSRVNLENVSGQTLAHRITPNRVSFRASIVGGANASDFELASMGQVLRFAGNGTRGVGSRTVIVRIMDEWGNTADHTHQIVTVSSARVSAVISDDFNRADGPLEDTTGYLVRGAASGAFSIVGNRVAANASVNYAALDLGSLGTSQQLIAVNFNNWNDSLVAFRMVDENNWMGFQRYDGGSSFRFRMCVAGVVSTLTTFNNINADQVGVRVQGRKMVVSRNPTRTDQEPVVFYPRSIGQCKLLTNDPNSEAGALLLPENAPLGTNVGLITSTRATSGWLDNFYAEALPS